MSEFIDVVPQIERQGWTFLRHEPLTSDQWKTLAESGTIRSTPRIQLFIIPRHFEGQISFFKNNQNDLAFVTQLRSRDNLLRCEEEGKTIMTRGQLASESRYTEDVELRNHMIALARAWALQWATEHDVQTF